MENSVGKKKPVTKRMMVFELKTKIVPKKNSFRAGITKNGRLYQYRKNMARESQELIAKECMVQKARLGLPSMLKGDVGIHAIFRIKRGDCVGLLETVLDALENVAYDNDRRVVQGTFAFDRKGELPDGVQARVFVNEV